MAAVELTTIRCKTCGTVLDEVIKSAVNGVVTCPSCTHVWTVARKEATAETLGFLQIGEHDLDVGKYDDAFTAYQKAAELDPKEPEAYFGMALAEFKIRYLKDHTANRLQPICGEVPDKQIQDSNAYMHALLNATPEQRVEYEKRGKEIDYILGEFRKYQKSGKKYDSFICVKVTNDETKQPTDDSRDAEYIYRLLKEKGYAPFYSELELRNETGADYEARILYALHTAECMLVVCRNADYLQTPWVKNEYTRFLKLVNDEEKESDSITIVFNGKPIEKLPGRAGKIQGINFALREADEKVVKFVDQHTPETRKRREEEKRKTAEKEKLILQQIEEQKRQQKELEDQLKNLKGGSGVQATASSLLTRGYQELAAKELGKADSFFDRVLEAEPENGEGWWGKLLVELNLWNDDQVGNNLDQAAFEKIHKSRNYRNAKNYAANSLFQERFDKANARLSETAQARTRQLNAKVEKLQQESSEDRTRTTERKASIQNTELAKAKENRAQIVLGMQEMPVKNKPDDPKIDPDRLSKVKLGRRLGMIAAFIHLMLVAVGQYITPIASIYNFLLPLYTSYKTLPKWITWNKWELKTFLDFLAIAGKSIVFGLLLYGILYVLFCLIPLGMDKRRHKAQSAQYSLYQREEARLKKAQDEIEKQEGRIAAEENSYKSREKKREQERTELNQSIKIYKAFL